MTIKGIVLHHTAHSQDTSKDGDGAGIAQAIANYTQQRTNGRYKSS